MLRSLFSGISGLKAHQQMMDVVSNNIANVNTIGYKSSNVVFEDTLSQLMRASASATVATGGLNPTQIGLGVELGAVQTNFLQGSTQITNKPTDLMIQNDGFFVLQSGNTQVYSRAGAFNLDASGYLVNSDGNYAIGYAATNGVVNSFGALSKIQLPVGLTIPGSASTTMSVAGNASPTALTVISTTGTVYDVNGAAQQLKIVLTPHEDDPTNPTARTDTGYDVSYIDAAGNDSGSMGTVMFDAAGNFDATNSTIGTPATPLPVLLADGVTTVNVDLSGLTGYSGTSSPIVKSSSGYAAGILSTFQVGPDGTVTGAFTNNQKMSLGQLALATFNNPNGLEKLGQSSYQASSNSGLAEVGVPGSGGRGTLIAGALEMSNVDLAAEFTNMIIAQRGFSANSKVITTSDEMLQDLVNIKR